jgi:hypothetical protein
MLRRERRGGDAPFNPLEESALREAGNILGGRIHDGAQRLPRNAAHAVAAALSELRPTKEILNQCDAALDDDVAVCCVETEFTFEEIGERFRGFFLLLPDSDSFTAIFRAVRLG